MSEEKIKTNSSPSSNPNQEETLKKLLEENIKISEEIKEHTKYIKKFVIISQVFGFLKLLIILIPIIIGIIYLPSLLDKAFEQYKDMLGIGSSLQIKDLNNLSTDLLKKIK